MKERINDKIQEIEKCLEELANIVPESFDDYMADFKSKAACERYAEKIIESFEKPQKLSKLSKKDFEKKQKNEGYSKSSIEGIVDLAFLFIKSQKFRMPEEDEGTFDILQEEKIISLELAKRLKEAKGMRNIIAHEYGEVDNNIVYNAIKEEIQRDAEEFIKLIGGAL